jgi:hypothetical protein
LITAVLLSFCGMTSGCATPVGPVEVTRFHVPQARLGSGPITVLPAPGQDGASLEFRSYAAAVASQLVRLGYREGTDGAVALVAIDRAVLAPERSRGPVSVGVGGSTGSYGSGVGLGIGLDLSGPPPEQVETRLSVMIRDRSGGEVQWEGRARFAVSAKSPLASTQLGAAKLAEALFRDFPGASGDTILVK